MPRPLVPIRYPLTPWRFSHVHHSTNITGRPRPQAPACLSFRPPLETLKVRLVPATVF